MLCVCGGFLRQSLQTGLLHHVHTKVFEAICRRSFSKFCSVHIGQMTGYVVQDVCVYIAVKFNAKYDTIKACFSLLAEELVWQHYMELYS